MAWSLRASGSTLERHKTLLAVSQFLPCLVAGGILLVVVVRFVPANARVLRSRLVQPIIRCGQQSLYVFCLGILLSVLGYFVFAEWSDSLTAQLAVNIAGVALMIGAGALITWYRNIDRDQGRRWA